MTSVKTIIFHKNFMDFFQNPKISQNTDFEKGKYEWITILNTTESTISPCICGHNVKHMTYLFNEYNQNIVSVGTTCCKKYGLLEKHMKNELLIHVLITQISQGLYKNSGNLLSLEKNIGELLENHIFERFHEIIKKYSRDMDENNYYFDVFNPLNRMKENILEFKKYGYDFSNQYEEICELIKEREMHITESESESGMESETNSEIIFKLDRIKDEIKQLFDEKLSEIANSESTESELSISEYEESYVEFDYYKKHGEMIQDIRKEFEAEIKRELEEDIKQGESNQKNKEELQENIRIQENIRKELEQDIRIQEDIKQAEEYLENQEKEVEQIVYQYYDGDIYSEYYRKYSERDLRIKMELHDLNMRIENLQKGIEEYKKDFSVFYNNLQIFSKYVKENSYIDKIKNR